MAYITLNWQDFQKISKLNDELGSPGLGVAAGVVAWMYYHAQLAERASCTREELVLWCLEGRQKAEVLVVALRLAGFIEKQADGSFRIPGAERQLTALKRARRPRKKTLEMHGQGLTKRDWNPSEEFEKKVFGKCWVEPKPKPKQEKVSGVDVWEVYKRAYIAKYKCEPIRNQTVNSQCCSIVRAVGVSVGQQIVTYYLTRHDAFYMNAKHPIGLCLRDLQKLFTEWTTGQKMTFSKAIKTEKHAETNEALRDYLARPENQDGPKDVS